MTRRKPRSGGHGLFDWVNPTTGDITPHELRANPLTVPCQHPTCRALQWRPCTDHRGRQLRNRQFHDSRRDDADTAATTPTHTEPPTP